MYIKEKKLEKRYLYDVSVKKEVIGQKYFILNIFDNHAVFTECDPFDFENCFTAKWTVLESLLKLSAEGFSSISKVADISMSALTQTAKIIVDNKKIMISTSTYRK